VDRFEKGGFSTLVTSDNNIQFVIEGDVCLLKAAVVSDNRALDEQTASPFAVYTAMRHSLSKVYKAGAA
jgi:hypothetical protein